MASETSSHVMMTSYDVDREKVDSSEQEEKGFPLRRRNDISHAQFGEKKSQNCAFKMSDITSVTRLGDF